MAVLGVIVVVGTVEVGWHDAYVVGTVLTIEVFAVLQSADFSQCIRLVGLFQFAGQQARFGHGLWCHAWIDARRAEELQLLAAVLPCGMYDVHLENHVFVHEVGGCALVCYYTSHLGCCQKHILGAFSAEECLDCVLACEVQFVVCTGNDVGISLAL